MFVKNHFALQELGRNVSQTSDPQQSSSPASVVAQFRRKSPFSANATFAQDGMNPISWNIQTLRFVWYAELWGTSIFFLVQKNRVLWMAFSTTGVSPCGGVTLRAKGWLNTTTKYGFLQMDPSWWCVVFHELFNQLQWVMSSCSWQDWSLHNSLQQQFKRMCLASISMWRFFSSSLVLISYEDQNNSVKEDHQVTGCCYGKNYPRGASPGDSTPSS